ncbi:hypothetical protein [Pseudomonas sp. NFACC13-1]|uniref:hypothetical protein n=1 Tax=Pseudomonas sp. NFACC13-1 TaxID=1566245 RepID=UPI0008846C9C|nr:hypothetical protein [Pseudomonas sp. NFACC13-1]SDB14695.1 hypothetical protein SAMN03159290_01019 [Pseudomonas sp. NFACC13-1]
MNRMFLKIAPCFAFLSAFAYAGENLSSKYWSLGWSNKATVVSKESEHDYIRVIPYGQDMRLAYLISGEGACPEGESSFKVQGKVNGKSLSFTGMCSDEYYKELAPATNQDQSILKHEFLRAKSVVLKIDNLPKRTFATAKFRSITESVGLVIDE